MIVLLLTRTLLSTSFNHVLCTLSGGLFKEVGFNQMEMAFREFTQKETKKVLVSFFFAHTGLRKSIPTRPCNDISSYSPALPRYLGMKNDIRNATMTQ
jgi:hypothetical protein